MKFFLEVVLVVSLIVQAVATVFALRLVRRTKYNVAWILMIIGYLIISVVMFLQLRMYNGKIDVSPQVVVAICSLSTICISVGVMFAHRMFKYIDRLNRQRTLLNKRLLTAVLRAEEKSKSRFAKELHDGMGPLLSSAKMSLTALKSTKDERQRAEIAANTTYVIDEAIRSLREISNNMQPQVLNDFGLARGVQNFINKSVAIHDVKIRFTTNLRNERFDSDVEIVMYRVICELINNSLKHAKCHSINLSLALADGVLSLEYTDDGKGFNPQAMMDCGMGLSNISSRVNSLNGLLDIASAKGKGMRASVKVDVGGSAH
ncbi:MAG: sensor histidine kinase [Alistipes sp.]|nr:sensor histidine kinase [Alistipes sp.]MBQ7342434.1 sensor histidine kinase [Alistipes sp.]